MNEKVKYKVEYKTKVLGVTSINVPGKLDGVYFEEYDEVHWCITDSCGTRRNLDEILELFQGKEVRVLIETLDGTPVDYKKEYLL